MTKRTDRAALPDFIEPMLSKFGQPFDSPDYLFEIKWDGTRCLCFVERSLPGGYRLRNRRRADLTHRYPEFAFLKDLPDGAVLDGEMVVLRNGKPDFALLQSRDHTQSPLKIKTLSRSTPATYIVFDLLYDHGEPVMDRPLVERRTLLERHVQAVNRAELVLSRGVVGTGKELFRQVVSQDMEGIIAKRLQSQYLPGRRTDAWIKIKRSQELYCLVIGFEPSGKDDFRSLILASDRDGKLTCVGKVGTGFDAAMRKRINDWLWSHLRPKPVIRCKHKGKWVEPHLICRVSCMELSEAGEMRAPSFQGLARE
ncbi:MAG: non-homologous end-joining DNA ligase [Gemmataceae bacterium]|nr:non-homologous end-joining DNA ligase [Gemmataceae bacterium]